VVFTWFLNARLLHWLLKFKRESLFGPYELIKPISIQVNMSFSKQQGKNEK